MLAPARAPAAPTRPSPPPAPPPRASAPRARRPRRGLVRALARQGADDGWYDAPATANFVDVRSEDELRHVMRTCYGNERASTLLVVEFYARWCNSCRRLYPRLCKLAAQEQDVLFVKIDFDACKDLCRALGVHKLPYFHLYNGSGARLAEFSASLDPAKFQRLTDAIDANRALRCAVNPAASVADAALASVADAEPAEPAASAETRTRSTKSASPALVKLHRVTFVWRGGGEDVMLAGDVAGGWTHQIAMTRVDSDDARADASIPPTNARENGPRFVDARDDGSARVPPPLSSPATHACACVLPTGTYRFKFIVDGAWRVSGAYPAVADADGNVNNELAVGAAHWPFEWVRAPAFAGSRFDGLGESSDGDYPGPPGRANDCVPVAIESRAASEEELRRERAEASASVRDAFRSKRRGPGASKSSLGSGGSSDGGLGGASSSSALAAPVSPGVAKAEAAEARRQSRSFDPDYRPPPSKAVAPPKAAARTRTNAEGDTDSDDSSPGASGGGAANPANPANQSNASEWPKKISAGGRASFSTKSERERRIADETAQAFRALKFQREEAARQRKLRGAALEDGTASGPGGGENPNPGGGLEGRLARIERILEDAGLGDDQDRWLSEG